MDRKMNSGWKEADVRLRKRTRQRMFENILERERGPNQAVLLEVRLYAALAKYKQG